MGTTEVLFLAPKIASIMTVANSNNMSDTTIAITIRSNTIVCISVSPDLRKAPMLRPRFPRLGKALGEIEIPRPRKGWGLFYVQF